MVKRIDPRYVNSLIDANVLDRLSYPEDAVVDEILSLADIQLQLPHSVKAEIDHPNTPPDVKRRACEFVYTLPVSLTPSERQQHQHTRQLIRGNARPGAHDRDAYHLVEAAKYGGYFITLDKRLLRKRSDIMQLLGGSFAIVTPTEFLEAYKSFEGQP